MRPLTEHEVKHGDIARVQADFDASERHVATACAPVIRKMVTRLVTEAGPHIATKDLASVADLSASYVPELADAMRAGAQQALALGRQQIIDWSGTVALEESPRLFRHRFPTALATILGSARLRAQTVADQTALAVRTAAARRSKFDDGGWTDEDLTGLDAAAAGYAAAQSAMLGREAMALGRTLELAAIVALAANGGEKTAGPESTTGQTAQGETPPPIRVVASLLRSEVLDDDDNTCAHCAEHDGDLYSDTDPDAVGTLADGLDAVPDPDCDGTLGNNVCRGILIPGD